MEKTVIDIKIAIPNTQLQKLLKKIKEEVKERKKLAKALNYKEAIEYLYRL